MRGRKLSSEAKEQKRILFSDRGNLIKKPSDFKEKKREVVFKPNPGSQEMFLSCPVFEVLLSGTRGAGKTLVLIMDFLKDVGVGWGASWRGIIFRQTYKQLFDVITKTKEWIPRIFPDANYLSADNKWVFPDGEQLLFRYMEREDDYWQYHGWEIPWCISEDTEVLMANGSYKQVKDIKIGEFVHTLKGKKMVLHKIPLINHSVYDMFIINDEGGILGFQEQSYQHAVLGSALDLINYSKKNIFSFCVSKENEDRLSFGLKKQRPFGVVLHKGEGKQVIKYFHPYRIKKDKSLPFLGSLGCSLFANTGRRKNMFDLQIQDENHYFTKLRSPLDINPAELKSIPFFKNEDLEQYKRINLKTYNVINKNCGWEELTNFPTSSMYDSIKSICRSSHKEIPKRYRSTTNPFGIGAQWVKARFIDVAEPCEVYTDEEGEQRCWINSSIKENKPFLDSDPKYLPRLTSAISDKAKRLAWTEGSWDIAVGGIFSDSWDRSVHVVKPFKIPKSWFIDVSYDYGSSKPFSVCFWAECTTNEEVEVNGEKRSFVPGTLFHVVEYYGYTGKADEGLRLNVTEVAKNIRDLMDNHYLLKDHVVHPGPADNAIFTSEANMPSIASRMLKFKDNFGIIRKGVRWKRSNKNPGSIKIGTELFRTMLEASLKNPQEEPGFFVFSDCRNFIRTVPSLPRDKKDPDVPSKDAEDHIWDATRYRILARKAKTVTQEV